MSLQTSISYGEFLDKLTILDIKSERIKDNNKLANINHERDVLKAIWEKHGSAGSDISEEYDALKKINERLWEIEDDIRDKERNKEFDQNFIELARSVYITNDERARIKKVINEKLGSDLVEEKSYSDYK
jgi:uncharacterized protein YukE